VLVYLCRRGEDCIGDLLLGDESLQRFLKGTEAPTTDTKKRDRDYPAMADAAIAGSAPGSSAGGEHPKFTACVRQARAGRHVLVKFSPGGTDRVAQRWSDLLTSEYLATQVLYGAGLTPTTTELLMARGRTFLEAERFDRHGARGRSGLVSLAALANQYLGTRDNWIAATSSLAKMRVISREDAETVRRLATFGRLIANTDMHFGNLSFRLSFERKLMLAPVYDMLPMLYAPTAGDVVTAREFDPPLPAAGTLDIWREIAGLAVKYWQQVCSHRNVSADFAALARRNAERVAAVAKLV
jgi:predicted nucleic acid-binding protein